MRGEYQSVRWIEAKNVGSTTLNPFALAEVSGAELSRAGHTILHIKVPTEDNVFPLAITNWMPIPASGYGVAAMEGPVYVQYYPSATPAVGEVWGPANGSQKANSGLTGLTVVGSVDSTREIVLVTFGLVGTWGTRGGCLDENHPGRFTLFDIHLGTWNSTTHKWEYDTENTVKATDGRYGVPYPDAGATGLFEPRASDTYGTIWEVVALDCSSPGACS